MEISKRLSMIAQCIPPNTNIVADIGTDHGYIPIYLIQNNIAKKCIACDINPKPLLNAKQNISISRMEQYIETRLGSGLSRLKQNETDVIVIAGMGGMLIIDILEKDLNIVKGASLLVLQPQLDIDKVRKYLHSIEFTILEEKMVYEDGKYYTILKAVPGIELPYSSSEYLFGKTLIDSQNPILKEFISSKLKEFTIVKDKLVNKKTIQAQNRLEELKKEITVYKEVLRCL